MPLQQRSGRWIPGKSLRGGNVAALTPPSPMSAEETTHLLPLLLPRGGVGDGVSAGPECREALGSAPPGMGRAPPPGTELPPQGIYPPVPLWGTLPAPSLPAASCPVRLHLSRRKLRLREERGRGGVGPCAARPVADPSQTAGPPASDPTPYNQRRSVPASGTTWDRPAPQRPPLETGGVAAPPSCGRGVQLLLPGAGGVAGCRGRGWWGRSSARGHPFCTCPAVLASVPGEQMALWVSVPGTSFPQFLLGS